MQRRISKPTEGLFDLSGNVVLDAVMNAQIQSCGFSVDSIEALYPGSRIVHTLYIVTEFDVAVLAAVAASLDGNGDSLRKYQVLREGDCFRHRLVLVGIGEDKTVQLKANLLKCRGVSRVQLEHRIERIQSHSECSQT